MGKEDDEWRGCGIRQRTLSGDVEGPCGLIVDDEVPDWQDQCMELLNDIYHNTDAQPFRERVDITRYPDYYRVIDTPMDLGTVSEALFRTGGLIEQCRTLIKI